MRGRFASLKLWCDGCVTDHEALFHSKGKLISQPSRQESPSVSSLDEQSGRTRKKTGPVSDLGKAIAMNINEPSPDFARLH